MFEQVVLIDKIEVVAFGVLQIREATIVKKDGVEIAKTYKRWCLVPGQNVSDQDARVQAVAAAVWTSDVVQAYQDHLASQQEGL